MPKARYESTGYICGAIIHVDEEWYNYGTLHEPHYGHKEHWSKLKKELYYLNKEEKEMTGNGSR